MTTVFRFLGKLSVLFIVVSSSVFSQAARSSVSEHTLGNGLRVIVKEDHRAPVVVSMVWYKVGSLDEENGTTGISHVLEHMMFKGTKKVPEGEFSKIIAQAGGRDNAFTTQDFTAFFQLLQKSKLPLAMKLEADRMQNLNFSRDGFAKEIKVVMEERRWRTDDNPHALVQEQLLAAAFIANPYRRPVVGWMNDLAHMRAEDVEHWYRTWYAPNNATLIVVGDVKPGDVFTLAQRYFGSIKPKALPVRKPQQEPQQLGVRKVTVKAPAKLPYLMMTYHAPVLRDAEQDWEPYALEVLAGVLSGNESARLNRSLVRETQVASSAAANYDLTQRGPGLFYLEGVPSEDKTVADLQAAMRVELQKIIDDGVTNEELERVKAQVIANQVFQRDSVMAQAIEIGEWEMAGLSYKSLDVLVDKLKAVSAEQVQAVAKKYFNDDNLTVAVLDPQPIDHEKPAKEPAGLRHD
ncbi:MAG TPA: pitrilysin family protein [Burkholderiales bacterium]|nr:pitrilysin family protein [Burkholderiales bacterium]